MISCYTNEMCLSPSAWLFARNKEGGGWVRSGHQLPSADWDKLTETVTTSDNSWYPLQKIGTLMFKTPDKLTKQWESMLNNSWQKKTKYRAEMETPVNCHQLTKIIWQKLATVDCTKTKTEVDIIWQQKKQSRGSFDNMSTVVGASWQQLMIKQRKVTQT